MKYILILLTLFISTGCNLSQRATKNTELNIYLKKIDGCEYVVYAGPKGCAIVHSASCHNPVHHNYEAK